MGCLFHKWHIVRDTGKTVYRQCLRCPKRDVFQRPGGYQPIDWGWLDRTTDELEGLPVDIAKVTLR